MNNPWKKINSHLRYDNHWIKVYQDEVIRPDGKEGLYGVVKTKGGVGIVAINDKEEIFLVSQFRYAVDVYSLEIPKGAYNSFDSSESPLDTAQRELKEETGISAETWIELGTVHTLMGYSDDTVHLFLAKDLIVSQNSPDDTEVIKIHTVPSNQIEIILRDGFLIDGEKIRMTDATSIAAIFLAKDFINKHSKRD